MKFPTVSPSPESLLTLQIDGHDRDRHQHAMLDASLEPDPGCLDVETSDPQPVDGQKPPHTGELQIFFSTFITIFLAELGDKTQVTTLLMSAESNAPWIVFLGSGSALIATSLIGVLLGRWLANHVSPRTLETITGGILLFVAVLLLWDVVHT